MGCLQHHVIGPVTMKVSVNTHRYFCGTVVIGGYL